MEEKIHHIALHSRREDSPDNARPVVPTHTSENPPYH
jgi:hypothetical protein